MIFKSKRGRGSKHPPTRCITARALVSRDQLREAELKLARTGSSEGSEYRELYQFRKGQWLLYSKRELGNGNIKFLPVGDHGTSILRRQTSRQPRGTS